MNFNSTPASMMVDPGSKPAMPSRPGGRREPGQGGSFQPSPTKTSHTEQHHSQPHHEKQPAQTTDRQRQERMQYQDRQGGFEGYQSQQAKPREQMHHQQQPQQQPRQSHDRQYQQQVQPQQYQQPAPAPAQPRRMPPSYDGYAASGAPGAERVSDRPQPHRPQRSALPATRTMGY